MFCLVSSTRTTHKSPTAKGFIKVRTYLCHHRTHFCISHNVCVNHGVNMISRLHFLPLNDLIPLYWFNYILVSTHAWLKTNPCQRESLISSWKGGGVFLSKQHYFMVTIAKLLNGFFMIGGAFSSGWPFTLLNSQRLVFLHRGTFWNG